MNEFDACFIYMEHQIFIWVYCMSKPVICGTHRMSKNGNFLIIAWKLGDQFWNKYEIFAVEGKSILILKIDFN